MPSEIFYLRKRISSVIKHFRDVLLPLWSSGSGFNNVINLPYESLDVNCCINYPIVNYRAMVCARHLYVYSSFHFDDYNHASKLFNSLQNFFFNKSKNSWIQSIDEFGNPLNDNNDLYTYSFIILACSAYFYKYNSSLARDILLETTKKVEVIFRRDDGLYNSVVDKNFVCLLGPLQNPIMHLAEAYLLAKEATKDNWFSHRLEEILKTVTDYFVSNDNKIIMEFILNNQINYMEPGHQFEWYSLLHNYVDINNTFSFFKRNLEIAVEWSENKGIDINTCGVYSILSQRGYVIDESQRIWPQLEYIKTLAIKRDLLKLNKQIEILQKCFLHNNGWYEQINSHNKLLRNDMPSSTLYHFSTCYGCLLNLFHN